MTNPYPISGSYLSNVYGICIITRRKADTLKLLHMAIDMGCFTFDADYYVDIFKFGENDLYFYCKTVQHSRLTINDERSEKFCNLYGLEWREDHTG